MPAALLYPKTASVIYGGWLPSSRQAYQSFFQQLADKVASRRRARSTHIQAVQDFENSINSDPEMVDLFGQIFLQAAEQNDIKDFDSLLHHLDIILSNPPGFIDPKDDDGNSIGQPIGVPIYIILDLLSNTSAAYDLFRMPAFNLPMKDLLDSWGMYLKSPASTTTLTDTEGGWFSEIGLRALQDKDRGEFNSTYICPKPEQVDRGFESWNDFFCREIQDSARPNLSGGNPDHIISACESAVYRIDRCVQPHDQFWLKSQKYSLYDILQRDDETARYFTGGTVYQAFLSPYDYHRWRAPVSGTIVRAEVIAGSYYAVLPDGGAEEGDPDFEPGAPWGGIIRSQPWLTQAATRAIILIKSDNSKIGTVAFIGVGMVEVSTCALSVEEGQRVEQGEEIGMFQFGGSTHALIFGPDAKITFVDDIEKDGVVKVNNHIKVRSLLGGVN